METQNNIHNTMDIEPPQKRPNSNGIAIASIVITLVLLMVVYFSLVSAYKSFKTNMAEKEAVAAEKEEMATEEAYTLGYDEGYADGIEYYKWEWQMQQSRKFVSGKVVKWPHEFPSSSLIVKADKDSNYYVWLVKPKDKDFLYSFMVGAGHSVEVFVPHGTYEIYYASGETWYGTELLFGSETVYGKLETRSHDGTYFFSYDYRYHYGWYLELFPNEEGVFMAEPTTSRDLSMDYFYIRNYYNRLQSAR